MLRSMTIELPLTTYRRLETLAQRKNRSIPDVVSEMVGDPVSIPPLPSALAAELEALTLLPDDVLLTLLHHPFPIEQQKKLAELTVLAQKSGLTAQEKTVQQTLGELSNRAVLRRTHCIEILHKRGHALDTLLTMPETAVL